MARVIDATCRDGSVVNPRFPAAVNTYMPTALTAAEAILRALAFFVPDKRIAGGSGSAALVLGGSTGFISRRARDVVSLPNHTTLRPSKGGHDAQSNRAYVHYEIFSGGTGARSGKDGVSATAFHLSNCKTAPIEIIESEFPTRVERFEMIPDSGGAGEWRGGLGFARDYRILADEVRFSMRTDKHAIAPFGSDGGLAGGKGACVVNAESNDAKHLPSRFGDHRLQRNDTIRVERPGGGGLGNPLKRPVDKVVEDVRQGYVTIDSARTHYGVALRLANGELTIQEEQTSILRGKI